MATTKTTTASASSVAAPTLRGAQDLAALYGNVQYDMDAIRGVYDKRTADEYAVKRKEYQQTENNYYGQMYNAGLTAQDTLRKGTAQAIMTGAGRGMQAATELSALLGLQQEGVKGATDLAVARNLLTDQEQAALSKNAMDALTASNDAKLKLGTLSGSLYAADTQFSAAQMAALAQEESARQQLAAAGITADGNVNAAKETAAGNIGAANAAGKWNFDATGLSADATRAAAAASARATENAARASASATRDAATVQAQATRDAAATQRAAMEAVNPALQTLVGRAMADGQEGTAIALIMQATGADKATAQSLLPKIIAQAVPITPIIYNTAALGTRQDSVGSPVVITPPPKNNVGLAPSTMGGGISLARR